MLVQDTQKVSTKQGYNNLYDKTETNQKRLKHNQFCFKCTNKNLYL